MPQVTDPLTCDTRWALQEWDFSGTSKATEIKTTEVPRGLQRGVTTCSPESQHGQTESVACDSVSLRVNGTPVYLATRCILANAPARWWRPVKIFSVDTKPSSQDIEQDGMKNSSGFLNTGPMAKFAK